MLDQRPHSNSSLPTAHLQCNRSRSQIVASVSFEAMCLHVAAMILVSIAASYVAEDFLMAEFEFVQVKRTFD